MTTVSNIAQSPSQVMSLVDLMRARAEQQPERQPFTFLIDGDVEGPGLTYSEIDSQARAIAASLQRDKLEGERALLLYPPGLAFVAAFYGALYAGVTAVTAPIPIFSRLGRTLPRLEAIARDAQPRIALTTSAAMGEIEKILPLSGALRSMRWMVTDTPLPGRSGEWREPRIDFNTLAFLQYTSGSTASPKGVMVSHGNLLHNSECIRTSWHYTSESVSVMWVPHIHDHGLVDGIVQPIHTGFRCILMPNLSIMQKPVRWLQAISRYRGTHSGGPNFIYDLCVRKIAPEQRVELDLKSWITAVNAAEPIRKETLSRFYETFAPCGFRESTFFPAYGLAESTLVVSGRHSPVFRTVEKDALARNRIVDVSSDAPEAVSIVGCGRPMPGTNVALVNPELMARCAPDEIGEVWVSSASVAGGYWNRRDETAIAFEAFISDTGEGPFLRTGDLGFLKDGELFIRGRLKDLVIVRGHNHYPQDIEYTVEKSHRALRAGCSAAFSIEADGEERVIVVAEVAARPSTQAKSGAGDDGVTLLSKTEHAALDGKGIVKAIRKAVAEEHDLNVYAIRLLQPGTIPKTSSGKIQRNACRIAFLTQSLEIVEETK